MTWAKSFDSGLAHRLDGQWAQAEAEFRHAEAAARVPHERHLAHFHASAMALAQGDAAWEGFESRLLVEDAHPRRAFAADADYWTGAPASSLLVWAEGGRGNTIQFSRYVAALASRIMMPLAFAVQKELVDLTRALLVNGDVEVLRLERQRPMGFTAHCSALSLPAIFQRQGWPDPPIPEAEPAAARVPLRVGLWWQGNPDYWDDARRSGTREMYRPLEALIPRVSLVDLQPPPHFANGGATLGELRTFIDRLCERLTTEIDLLVTTDTAAAHLGGVLGLPTWLLLHHAPNWRWAKRGPAVVGPLRYGSVRTFRQCGTCEDDWTAVVGHVRVELAALVGASL